MMKHMTFLGAAALLFSSTALNAAFAIEINGDTTGQPTWNRPFTLFNLSGQGTDTPYQAHQITVTNSASFSAETTTAVFDTFLLLYQGTFDPTQQFTNLVAVDDDGGVGLLSRLASTDTDPNAPYQEGQYTIVVTGFDNADFGTYILTLNGVVIGWGPSTAQQLAELQSVISDNGRNNLQVVSANVGNAAKNSFEARMRANGQGDGSFAEGDMLSGNVHVWANGSVTHADSSGRSFTSPLMQFGADVAINESFIVGLSGGLGSIKARSAGYTFDATQTLVQPYIGWNTGDWHGTASLTFGWIDYDTIVTPAGAATAKGEMIGFSADVNRDFMVDATTTVSPFAAIETGRIKLTATTGTLAGAGIANDVDFTETRLGAKITKVFDNHKFSAGLSADHFSSNAPTALSSGQYDTTGWSASATAGYSVQLNDTALLDAGVRIGGIGNDGVNYTGTLNVSVKF
ncbi:autotransporter domain-containing protein [Hoeflea sp.]|uniref:autotransporter domain-containing protein n=1 Tax=Hoeflea sp. TaxID=1940281 RepID=UPI003BAEECDA